MPFIVESVRESGKLHRNFVDPALPHPTILLLHLRRPIRCNKSKTEKRIKEGPLQPR